MLFPMPPVTGAPPRPPYAEQIWLTTSFGRVEAWYLPPIGTHERAGAVVAVHARQRRVDRLLAGGIRRAAQLGFGRAARRISRLRPLGWVAFADRRSPKACWPHTTGHSGMRARQRRASFLTADRSAAAPPRSSLEARPVPALILESSFSSVAAFASGFGAPRFCCAIRSTASRRSVIQGTRPDPARRSRRHRAAAPRPRAGRRAATNATLTFMPCGHNDCPRPWADVRAFLSRNGLLPRFMTRFTTLRGQRIKTAMRRVLLAGLLVLGLVLLRQGYGGQAFAQEPVIKRSAPMTLTGEIVDISCYKSKGVAGGTGAAHVDCAKICMLAEGRARSASSPTATACSGSGAPPAAGQVREGDAVSSARRSRSPAPKSRSRITTTFVRSICRRSSAKESRELR